MRIKVVGPCASGKSALAARLRDMGYDASSAAQDHSFVPDMWQRVNPPDLLIFLDVSLETARQRGRTGMGWDQAYLDEQHHRLRHAKAHCDLYLPTDDLSEDEVLAQVRTFVQALGGQRKKSSVSFASASTMQYNGGMEHGNRRQIDAVRGAGKGVKMSEPRAIGSVVHYWTRLGVAGVALTGSLKVDDWVHFRGALTDFQQRVTSMQLNRCYVQTAEAGQQVGILVADRVRVGDTVFLLGD